jgi:serine/threonine-protein kinase
MTGTQVGNYEFVEKVGSGAMGVVYRGRHRVLHHDVALKVLREELAHEEVVAARFIREAQFGVRLDHPAVVRVYDIVSEDGKPPFIVMQFVEGETLQHLIKRGPLPVERAVHIAREILAALQAAHAANIVHRDIKPGNIFVGQDGKVKVGDFGIARAGGESGGTVVGALVGAPHYLSPEQVEGKDAQPRSDLYSVGIVLYEMLCGHVPFRAETQLAIMHMQVAREPPPLPDSIPERLRKVVEKALAKNPDDRYASAAQFLEALRAPEILVPSEERPPIKWWPIVALASGLAVVIAAATLWPRALVEKVVEEVPLQYSITQRAAPDLAVGQKHISTKGQTGTRRTVYNVTYSANLWGRREIKRDVVDEQVTRRPTDEVVWIGTRRTATLVERRPIPFQTVSTRVYRHPGETVTVRAGQQGEAEVTWRVESICDLEGKPLRQLNRKIVGWKKLKSPQNAMVEVGVHRLRPQPNHASIGHISRISQGNHSTHSGHDSRSSGDVEGVSQTGGVAGASQ